MARYLDEQEQMALELSAEQGLIPLSVAFPATPKKAVKTHKPPESVLDKQLLDDLELEQGERSV